MLKDQQGTGIAARRLGLGITQTQLGELVGIDQSRVSRAEKGNAPPEIVIQLHRMLDTLEQQRILVDHAEADTFWSAVGDVPHRERLIGRLEQVTRTLMDGSIRDNGLAYRLLACLPTDVRQRLKAKV